jgi:serine/threonine protein kinase
MSEEEETNYMITLHDFIEDNYDIWLIFEKGGKSLSNLVFKIKGEFLGNERIYSIKKGKFLVHLFENIENLKSLMRKMFQFLHFLNESGIVHCDLKPDNLLVDYEYNEENSELKFKKFKIIDFGSAFFLKNPDNFSSNTPEYMSPEINELMEKNVPNKDIIGFLKNLKKWPWCIDMWSFGVTILEIILSCPSWMSYKAKTIIHGKVPILF